MIQPMKPPLGSQLNIYLINQPKPEHDVRVLQMNRHEVPPSCEYAVDHLVPEGAEVQGPSTDIDKTLQ